MKRTEFWMALEPFVKNHIDHSDDLATLELFSDSNGDEWSIVATTDGENWTAELDWLENTEKPQAEYGNCQFASERFEPQKTAERAIFQYIDLALLHNEFPKEFSEAKMIEVITNA